jgi:hypothetical protein
LSTIKAFQKEQHFLDQIFKLSDL